MSNRVMRVQDILNSSTPFEEEESNQKREMSYSVEKSYNIGDYGHEVMDDSLLKTTPSISAFDKIEELQQHSILIEQLLYKMMNQNSRQSHAKEALIKLRQMTFEACTYLENYEERKIKHKRKYEKSKEQIEKQVKQKYKHKVREAKQDLDILILQHKGLEAKCNLSMKDKFKLIQTSQNEGNSNENIQIFKKGINTSSFNLGVLNEQISPNNVSALSRTSIDLNQKMENVQSKLNELCRDTPPPGQITSYTNILSGMDEKTNSNLDQAFIGSEFNSKLLASINKSESMISQEKTNKKVNSARGMISGVNLSINSLGKGPVFTDEQLREYFGNDYSKLSDTQREKVVFNLMNRSIEDAHHVKLDEVLNSTKSMIKDISADPLSARLFPQQPKDSTFIALLSSRNNSSGYIPLSVRQQIRQYNLAQQMTKRSNLDSSAPKESARALDTNRVTGEGGKVLANHECLENNRIDEIWEKESEERKSHQISPVNPFKLNPKEAVIQAIGTSSSQSHFSYITPSESNRRTTSEGGGGGGGEQNQVSGIGTASGEEDDEDIQAVMDMLGCTHQDQNNIIQYTSQSPIQRDEAILIDDSAISSIQLDGSEDSRQEKDIFDNFLDDSHDPLSEDTTTNRVSSAASKKSPNFCIPKLNLQAIGKSPIKKTPAKEEIETNSPSIIAAVSEKSLNDLEFNGEDTLNLDLAADIVLRDNFKDFDQLSSIESHKSDALIVMQHHHHQSDNIGEIQLEEQSPIGNDISDIKDVQPITREEEEEDQDEFDEKIDDLFGVDLQLQQQDHHHEEEQPRLSLPDTSSVIIKQKNTSVSEERKVIGKAKIKFKKKAGEYFGKQKSSEGCENSNNFTMGSFGVNSKKVSPTKQRQIFDITPPPQAISPQYNINENSLLNQRLKTAEFRSNGAESRSPPHMNTNTYDSNDINKDYSYMEEKSQDRSMNQYSIRIKSRNSNKKSTKDSIGNASQEGADYANTNANGNGNNYCNTSNISSKGGIKIKKIKISTQAPFVPPPKAHKRNMGGLQEVNSSSSQTPNSDNYKYKVSSVGRTSIASDQRVISPEYFGIPQTSKSVPKLADKPAVYNRKNQFKKFKPLISKQSLVSKIKEDNDAQSGGSTIQVNTTAPIPPPPPPPMASNAGQNKSQYYTTAGTATTSRNPTGRRVPSVKSLKSKPQNVKTPQHEKQLIFSQQQNCLTQTLNGIQMLIPTTEMLGGTQILPPLSQTQKGKSPRVGLSLKNVNIYQDIQFNQAAAYPISPSMMYPQNNNNNNSIGDQGEIVEQNISNHQVPSSSQNYQFGNLMSSPLNPSANQGVSRQQQLMSNNIGNNSTGSTVSPIINPQTQQDNFLYSSIGSGNKSNLHHQQAIQGGAPTDSIISSFYLPSSPHSQDRSVQKIQQNQIRQFLSNPPPQNNNCNPDEEAQVTQLKKTVMKRKAQLSNRKIKLVDKTMVGSRLKTVNQTIIGAVKDIDTSQVDSNVTSTQNKSLNVSTTNNAGKKVFRMKRFFKHES